MEGRSQSPAANTRIEVRVQRALSRAASARAFAVATQAAYVFRPGAPPPPNSNIYDDWSKLVADVAAHEGPKLVQLDASLLSPVVIPPGVWVLSDDLDITMEGTEPITNVLAFGTVRGVNSLRYVTMKIAGSQDFIDVSSTSGVLIQQLVLREVCNISTLGTGALVNVNDGAMSVYLTLGSVFNTGTAPVAKVTGTGRLTIDLYDFAAIYPNTIGNAGLAAFFSIELDTDTVLYSPIQAACPGGRFAATRCFTIDASPSVQLTDLDQPITFDPIHFIQKHTWFLTATPGANRTFTLDTTNAYAGARVRVTRRDTNAFTMTFLNGGPAAGTITTFAGGAQASMEAQFDGADWIWKGF